MLVKKITSALMKSNKSKLFIQVQSTMANQDKLDEKLEKIDEDNEDAKDLLYVLLSRLSKTELLLSKMERFLSK